MKKPVALILTDTHLKKDNFELVFNIFKQAVTLCKKLKIDIIFHLADFFDARAAQPLRTLKKAQEIIRYVNEAGIRLYIIPGNHDKDELDSDDSYLDLYKLEINYGEKETGNLIESETSSFFFVNEKFYQKLNILWLPYYKENGSYRKRLEDLSKFIQEGKKNILLTHVAIDSVKNNDGTLVSNNLKTNLFKKFDLVLVGHYHNYSQIADNIVYIGSAYQANFGEDDKKGFTILYDNGEIEFIQSEFPKYIHVKIKATDKKTLAKYQKYSLNGDNVRITIVGTEEEVKAIEKMNFAGIDVKYDKQENNFEDLNDELIIFNRENIKKSFNEFRKLNNIEESDVFIEYLEKVI